MFFRLLLLLLVSFACLLRMSPILAASSAAALTLNELNNATAEEFNGKLGGIFENSPWVVAQVAAKRPFRSVEQMMAEMMDVVRKAGKDKQMALVRAHPDLAGKAAIAGNTAEHSKKEQTGAGLSHLSPAQMEQFQSLNAAYKAKFNFPFILALRDQKEGHSGVGAILESFRQRMNNTEAEELEEDIRQIGRIAHFRLVDLVQQEDE